MNFNTIKSLALGFALATAVAAAQAGVLYVDVGGIKSNEELGDPMNERRDIYVGGDYQVTAISWDVTLFADLPSWLSELKLNVGNDYGDAFNLTPGVADNSPGTESYSSGGIIDLVALGLDFSVGLSGMLRLEFFEGFNDFVSAADGEWVRGSIGLKVVPEPGTYALAALALLGIGASSRRRRQD